MLGKDTHRTPTPQHTNSHTGLSPTQTFPKFHTAPASTCMAISHTNEHVHKHYCFCGKVKPSALQETQPPLLTCFPTHPQPHISQSWQLYPGPNHSTPYALPPTCPTISLWSHVSALDVSMSSHFSRQPEEACHIYLNPALITISGLDWENPHSIVRWDTGCPSTWPFNWPLLCSFLPHHTAYLLPCSLRALETPAGGGGKLVDSSLPKYPHNSFPHINVTLHKNVITMLCYIIITIPKAMQL